MPLRQVPIVLYIDQYVPPLLERNIPDLLFQLFFHIHWQFQLDWCIIFFNCIHLNAIKILSQTGCSFNREQPVLFGDQGPFLTAPFFCLEGNRKPWNLYSQTVSFANCEYRFLFYPAKVFIDGGCWAGTVSFSGASS